MTDRPKSLTGATGLEPAKKEPLPPRWSQTCPNGHFSRVRDWTRPTACPQCGSCYAPPRDTLPGGRSGRVARNGSAATSTVGGKYYRPSRPLDSA